MSIQKKFVLVKFISIFVIQSKLKMKSLSTLFTKETESPRYLRNFIVLHLLLVLGTGLLFGQNQKVQTQSAPLTNEVKHLSFEGKKQKDEKKAPFSKQNGQTTKALEGLKNSQNPLTPGMQPTKIQSLKNSENSHLGVNTFIGEPTQTNIGDRTAAPKMIDSERPLQRIKNDQNQISNQSPFESVKGKREDVSKRDLYSKTYQNEDGSFTALIGAGPIHYQKNGQFLDIDHKITQNFDQTYPFVNATNLFQSYFGATSHTGLKNKTDDGELREFLNTKMFWEVNGQPYGLINSANTPIQVEGDKAYYRNIYGNIDVEFTMLTGKRELNYIIPNQAALGNIPENATYLVFSEDVVLPIGWTHEVTDKGIVIKNTLGQSVYLYSNPVSKDDKETLFLSKENNTIYETRLIGNTLTVLTKVKTEWLLSYERVFPVMVDPTVSVYTTNATKWTGFAENYLPEYGGDDTMAVGKDYGNNMSGFSKYNLSSIAVGSTINSVYSWQYYAGRQGIVNNRSFTLADITVDPVTAGWYSIYNSSTQLVTDYAWTVTNTFGWVNMEMNGNGRTFIQNRLTSGWAAICLYVNDGYVGTNYHVFSGYSNANRPFLVIDYTVPSGCSGTPDAGEVAVGSHVDNPGQQYIVVAVGYSQGTGIEYKWQKRTSVNYGAWSGWSDVTSYNSTYSGYTATAPAAGTREEWRLQVRCTNGNNTANSTTDVFYSSDCYQGDGFELNPEDGYGITSSSNFRVADDFIVPQYSSFSIRTITMDVFTAGTVTNATLNIRKDDGGVPGSVVATRTMAPTRIMYWGDFLGVIPWYRLSFDLATPINLGTGTYWLEPTVTASGGNTVYWATTYGTTGGVAALSNDSGATWTPDYDEFFDMVFFVVGDCNSCDAVTATASNTSVCEGDTVTLSANSSGAYTYHWYIGWSEQYQTFEEDLGTGATKTVTVDESTSYWVVATNNLTGCRDYTWVTVGVTPPPSLIVMDPIESITCSDETREINLIDGGVIPETILEENWDPPTTPWIVSTATLGGPGPEYARWGYTNNWRGITSPDNSNFMVVDSDNYGEYEMQSSLISPPMSLIDYNSPSTNITLTFNHLYWTDGFGDAYIDVTTDGVNWVNIKHYTSDQGNPPGSLNFKGENIDLNTYKGVSFFQIRFRYEAFWDWFWAIDDIKITGTNPLPTTVTWEVKDSNPVSYAGLYTDAAGTIPYTGGHATTLYASPSTTTTYTISAKTSVGCPAEEEVTVERGDKNWISPSSTDWNIAANWNEGGVPTAEHCVRIPSTSNKPIINGTTNAFAKNVVVEDGGGLTIASGGSLTVTDYFRHEGTGNEADVVIKHDGNLIQINDAAVNSGEITVEKDFKFSAERKQYNFVSAPVVSGRDMKTSIYTPNPTSVQQYNTATDYFDETVGPYVSGLAYAVKEPPGSGTATVPGKLMGVPFNGVLNYPLNTSGAGYNLIGNPYPSNLDIYSLYHSNHEKLADANFFFWDNTNNTLHEQHGPGYNGDHYAKYNAVSNTGTAAPCNVYGSGCDKIPDRFVKVGAGFLVKAASDTLDFNNSYRTTDGSIDFFGKGFASETLTDRYWLAITTPSDIKISSAVVYFEGGNDAFAIDDTESFLGSDDLHSIADGHPLAIQGKAPFHINDQVPLGYKAFENGTYILSVFKTEGVFAQDQDIYLIDKLLGKTVNLSQKPYKFMTRAGQYSDRFVVVYKPSISTGVAVNASNQILFSKQNNQMVIISTIDKITEIELFNLNSRSVYKKTGIHANEHRIDVNLFDHQIVVVTVKTETGEFVTSKFVNH